MRTLMHRIGAWAVPDDSAPRHALTPAGYLVPPHEIAARQARANRLEVFTMAFGVATAVTVVVLLIAGVL